MAIVTIRGVHEPKFYGPIRPVYTLVTMEDEQEVVCDLRYP